MAITKRKKPVKRKKPLVLPANSSIVMNGNSKMIKPRERECAIDITIERRMFNEAPKEIICSNCMGTGKSSKERVSWSTIDFDSYQKAEVYMNRLNDIHTDGSIRLTEGYRIVEKTAIVERTLIFK